MPKLQGDHRVRPEASGAALRILRVGANRPLRGDEVPHFAGINAPLYDSGSHRARQFAHVVWQSVVRAKSAEEGRVDRHGEGNLFAVLDVRRAGARRLAGGVRLLLLRDRNVSRFARAHAVTPGAKSALATQRRATGSFFR